MTSTNAPCRRCGAACNASTWTYRRRGLCHQCSRGGNRPPCRGCGRALRFRGRPRADGLCGYCRQKAGTRRVGRRRPQAQILAEAVDPTRDERKAYYALLAAARLPLFEDLPARFRADLK